ncbi:MAG: hypothetical protein ABIT96_10005 [Ferruginibacter sp.]
MVLKTFDNYFSANITLTRLQDAGVKCFLRDEFTVTIDPILSNAIGGIKLEVHEQDVALAEVLLHKFEKEYLEMAICPKCHTHTIDLVPNPEPQNVITSILTWLIGSYAVSIENIYRCSTCGFESKTLPENNSAWN